MKPVSVEAGDVQGGFCQMISGELLYGDMNHLGVACNE